MKRHVDMVTALFVVIIIQAMLIGYLLAALGKARNNERELSQMVYRAVKSTQPLNIKTNETILVK